MPLDRVIDENHEFFRLLGTVDVVRLGRETFAFKDNEREVEGEGEWNTWSDGEALIEAPARVSVLFSSFRGSVGDVRVEDASHKMRNLP